MGGPAYETITAKIEAVTGYRPSRDDANWRCPNYDAHLNGDRTPSLSVTNGDGRVLLYCHGPCHLADITAALNVTLRQLFDQHYEQAERPDDAKSKSPSRTTQIGPPVATYSYHDADGNLVALNRRYEPKTFRPETRNAQGKWTWGLKGMIPPLYNLPAIRRAVAEGERVWIVEGEKDADAMIPRGEVATTSMGGGNSWKGRGELYAPMLKDAYVIVVRDKDRTGHEYASSIVESLEGVARRVSVVEAKEGKDAYDHLRAGYGVDEFLPVDITVPFSESENEPLQDQKGKGDRIVDGETFLFDYGTDPPPIWGDGEMVLWAAGESLLLNGPTGVGKTTLGQQVVMGRLGIQDKVLGLSVTPGSRKTLYIAADRPRQARRSLSRMVTGEDRERLRERLVVHRGPLGFDLAKEPGKLLELANEHDADTVVIDSLKDVAMKLSDDETGSGVNMAVQMCVAEGIEVLVLHHQRKGQAGTKPKGIDDVYGSAWIASGAGSVVVLWGEPGDSIVELLHLKQPIESVGPWKVLHDHDAGSSAVVDEVDVLGLVAGAFKGITARFVAMRMFDTADPTRGEVERARRKLDRMVRESTISRRDGHRGRGDEALYLPL